MSFIDLGLGEVEVCSRAMGTQITVRLAPGGRGADETDRARAVEEALGVFRDVEASCTRFDPESPLMQANNRPDDWHKVPKVCFDALVEAWTAYNESGGRFEPRVLTDLVALGYDRSFPFDTSAVTTAVSAPRRRLSLPPWRPRFRHGRGEVCLGGLPVDLGGIGKGLAVRWASEDLRPVAPDHVVNAGGDCYCAGLAPDGEPWRVGIEDPMGGPDPVVVVALSDNASTTSSTRVRQWTAGGVPVHHLIDARSGLPGGHGLAAVTVIAPDPASAEMWSKVLFLTGQENIASETARRSLAACWVGLDGIVDMSLAMERFVVWHRP